MAETVVEIKSKVRIPVIPGSLFVKYDPKDNNNTDQLHSLKLSFVPNAIKNNDANSLQLCGGPNIMLPLHQLVGTNNNIGLGEVKAFNHSKQIGMMPEISHNPQGEFFLDNLENVPLKLIWRNNEDGQQYAVDAGHIEFVEDPKNHKMKAQIKMIIGRTATDVPKGCVQTVAYTKRAKE
jgi:hypothetical protein